MKNALLYVFLIWITTIILSPLIYYYAFGNPALIITYPLTLLLTLPGAVILVFVAAIINRELENPPLKKLLVGLCGVFLIVVVNCLHSENLREGWTGATIYCGVLILSSLVYRLKPR